jgi:4-hydroxy-tetrahydrodipicolinate synthase
MSTVDSNFLRGAFVPLITPFKDTGEVDYDAYARLVELQITSGSHGIVVNGTTAEPSVLTVAERKKVLEIAIEVTRARLPVMAATGSQSFDESCALTEHAESAGAAAVLIVTPYYIRPPQRGLVVFYNELGRRTRLPMLIYHIPGRAAVSLTIDTLAEIVAATPHLVGIKHAATDLGLVTEALRQIGPNFRIFVGLEELSLPMLALGACGMVNAVSNIAPKQVSRLYDAVAEGDLTLARRLHSEMFELNRAVFYDTNPIPIKYMAKRLGILAHNHHRLPMLPATPELEKRLDAVLLAAGLLETGRD